ncbi:MAG: tRNA dihydrouridine synthase DusB [Clostridia bacterium]|nr:tRNA dihydrouridine synthase DusB [Clostridia bacterium]
MKLPFSTPRIALAPMAGVTDHAFRTICREQGADFLVTEMISAKAMHYQDRKTAELARLWSDETAPTAIQIFGSEPLVMAEAAEALSRAVYKHCLSPIKPACIDINMGCPAPKVANNGEGSALLKSPQLAEDIVRAVVRASEVPVTVKMRIGWDEQSICGVDFAKRMEDAGASMLVVHGRTREGRFSAPINFDELARIKAAVKIPVLANGEIFTAADAKRMLERTGCDGVMIGRGAMGNPWIFAEIKAAMEGRSFTPPTVAERVETALRQLRIVIAERGERMGVISQRGQLAWYLKGIKGAAGARGAITSASTYDEVERILRGL